MFGDWEARMDLLICKWNNRVFEYGKTDCLLFANDIAKTIHGVDDFGAWMIGRYSRRGIPFKLETLRRKLGVNTFHEAISRDWPQVPPPYVNRGMIVASDFNEKSQFDCRLGLMVGTGALFLAEVGLEMVPLDQIKNGWNVHA